MLSTHQEIVTILVAVTISSLIVVTVATLISRIVSRTTAIAEAHRHFNQFITPPFSPDYIRGYIHKLREDSPNLSRSMRLYVDELAKLAREHNIDC